MNCLIAEDDLDDADLMLHRLGHQGSVTITPSLAGAREILAKAVMDLLIMDLTLIDSQPAQTVAAIREIKREYPHTRLVIVTGDGRDEVGRMAYSAGADLVLSKANGFKSIASSIMSLKPCLDSKLIDVIERTVKSLAGRPLPQVSERPFVAKALDILCQAQEAPSVVVRAARVGAR